MFAGCRFTMTANEQGFAMLRDLKNVRPGTETQLKN